MLALGSKCVKNSYFQAMCIFSKKYVFLPVFNGLTEFVSIKVVLISLNALCKQKPKHMLKALLHQSINTIRYAV